MNAIANRSASVAIHAIPPPEPHMPPGIAHAVASHLAPVVGRGQFGRDDPGHYVAPPTISEREWKAAQQIAAQFDAMLAPVTREVLAAWLMPVNAASRNPQSPQEFALRVAGIVEMVADLPAAAFTAETRRRLASGFFPSHEDVRAAVEPVAATWRRKRDALRALRHTGQPASAAPTDPGERAQIAAGLASLRAELQGRAMPAERPAPKPRHLTGDALSAARASVGIGA